MGNRFIPALAAALVISLSTACAKQGNSAAGSQAVQAAESSTSAVSGALDISRLKTLGDVFALESGENNQESYTETVYVYVWETDGVYYRAVAELPGDISEALWALDFDDADRNKKLQEMLSPLPVSVENLSEQMPAKEELDQLVGKTGRELFDEGWTYWYYNLDEMEAGLYHGVFSYNVRFSYDGEPLENTDDFDFYETFGDLKVESIVCEGIGDAASIE